MPELPEVESLRRILVRSAVGRTIVSAKVGEARLRRRVTADFAQAVAGRRIVNLSRRAKYLIIELDGDDVMLVTDAGRLIRVPADQVRMTGRQAMGVTLFRVDAGEHVTSVFPVIEDAAEDPGENGVEDGPNG